MGRTGAAKDQLGTLVALLHPFLPFREESLLPAPLQPDCTAARSRDRKILATTMLKTEGKRKHLRPPHVLIHLGGQLGQASSQPLYLLAL